jgi:ribosome-associated heat shock protein Hsp15
LPGEGQRVDRWIWHARVVRTRSLAVELAESGRIRVNGQRVNAPARMVRTGDVLTIALHSSVKVLRVIGFAERRGSARDIAPLYEDLSEPAPPRSAPTPPTAPSREPGSGRPTKRDRRALDRMRQRGPDIE